MKFHTAIRPQNTPSAYGRGHLDSTIAAGDSNSRTICPIPVAERNAKASKRECLRLRNAKANFRPYVNTYLHFEFDRSIAVPAKCILAKISTATEDPSDLPATPPFISYRTLPLADNNTGRSWCDICYCDCVVNSISSVLKRCLKIKTLV